MIVTDTPTYLQCDRSYRNVGKYQPTLRDIQEQRTPCLLRLQKPENHADLKGSWPWW
jgi:hypothetical protein